MATAMLVAVGTPLLVLPVASGAAHGKRRGAKRVTILGATQNKILKRGLRVRLPAKHRRGLKVKATSTTFDDPTPARLTKSARARGHRRVVHLKLTAAGKAAIRSCEARQVQVRAGKRNARADLVRDSAACGPKPIDLSRAADCDFIGQQQESRCLLPFPDDYYTVSDPSTATGRRIDLHAAAMPKNAGGTPIDPSPYLRNDGFSPGQGIVLKVPGLDSTTALQQTGASPLNHLGRYADPDAPVIVIDAMTGQRQPIWVEIDSNASSPAQTALEIHPAVNLASGHRYIVALRNLRDAAGQTIPAPEGFRYYRDQLPSSEGPINAQRSRFESIFNTLRGAGIRRSNLYLAWDFTVASDENIAARELHIRDDALASLGDTTPGDGVMEGNAPDFHVTQVDNFTPVEDPEIARRVRGTFTVPCYLQPNCGPGGSFQLGADGLPSRNAGNDWTANFDCIIPRTAIDGTTTPGRPAIYGHGLFGSASEVFNADIQQELANTYGFVLCATDEIGMANGDVGNTIGILGDLSRFPQLADRLQQGLLDEIFLGRLMAMPSGLASDGAFHVDGTTGSDSVIDDTELYYQGSSQGGIMGGALTAVDPDFTRAVLNVPAMNYSVLLPRSVDYDEFALILNASYTDELSRPLILSLIQMLWDRGEPNGYAHRMTSNPLPGTPAHRVLMNVALGDHQVTNFQSDVEARTIGASTHTPILDPGRWPDYDILWNVPAISTYPFDGSAVVYGDIGPVRPNPTPPPTTIGVSPPPLTNTPNREGEDPHGAPRGAPLALQLISDFLKPDGAVTNPCGASPCYAGGYTGPGP
ncbi:MAG TPA: hypothetical protein VLB79_09235 [Solirubrobacterales bacterium]|nr:hypothetical protein [Solirubrobacterales bacterium]